MFYSTQFHLKFYNIEQQIIFVIRSYKLLPQQNDAIIIIITLVEMLTRGYSYFSVNFMAKTNIACIS